MRIGLLLLPGCMPAGLLAFADLMHAANRRAAGKRALFECVLISITREPVECAHGVVLMAKERLGDSKLDAILVPGFLADSVAQIEALLGTHRRTIGLLAGVPRSTALWSYCTGVALVAASGRLKRREATASWWLAPWLQQRYASVRWSQNSGCVYGKDVATASGAGGYLQIGEQLLSRMLSPDQLRDIIAIMVLPRPQAPHPALHGLRMIEVEAPVLRRLHALVEVTPAAELQLSSLASELAMSGRTLARQLRTVADESAAAYIRRIKLNQVSERLINTRLSVAAIADALGYSSTPAMIRAFKALTGATPSAYRSDFSRV